MCYSNILIKLSAARSPRKNSTRVYNNDRSLQSVIITIININRSIDQPITQVSLSVTSINLVKKEIRDVKSERNASSVSRPVLPKKIQTHIYRVCITNSHSLSSQQRSQPTSKKGFDNTAAAVISRSLHDRSQPEQQ